MTKQIGRTKIAAGLASSAIPAALCVAALCALHPLRAAAKAEEATSAHLHGEAAVAHLQKSGAYDSLAAAVTAARYRAERDETGARVMNDANGFEVSFAGSSWQLKSTTQEKRWVSKWRLRSFGYGREQTTAADGGWHSAENRVELRRDSQQITEWFVNSPDGVEHGFTLAARPGTAKAGEPLRLVMKLEGDLTARADGDGQVLTLLESSGAEALRYENLKVWDARGTNLSARMRTEESGEVWLEVDEAAAVYPITIDPTFVQRQKLTPNVGSFESGFGTGVALSGDTAIIGARWDTIGANDYQGSAYIFVRSGTTWTFQQKLTASDGAAYDAFGRSVAISGDTVIAGAYQAEIGENRLQGAAYVFVRSGTTWTEQQKLTGTSNAQAGDRFGYSVAISGDTALVGAYGDDTGEETEQGAAYIFVRSGTAWQEHQRLTASDGEDGDRFGYSVAVSADTAIIGAYWDEVGGGHRYGSAYIFVRSGTSWAEQQKLTASDGGIDAEFGEHVDISGETVIVGAGHQIHSTTEKENQSSAYIFVRSGTVWTEQQRLVTSDGWQGSLSGCAVAISGEVAIVGATFAGACVNGCPGVAYLFVRTGTTWIEHEKLTASDGAPYNKFGASVAIEGITAIIGAPDTADAGAAYVFVPEIIVNTTTDEADPNPADGICDVTPEIAGTQCTLRAAIETANATPELDKISFDIPGAGIQSIAATSDLPPVTERVFINGTTQPGYTDTPLIEVQGTSAGETGRGLLFAPGSDGSQVTALTINRFRTAGIEFQSNENRLTQSYIGVGVGPNGVTTYPEPDGGQGSGIIISGGKNQIGGDSDDVANIVGGNLQDGIVIRGAEAVENTFSHNFVGVTRDGTAIGNGGNGFTVVGSLDITIQENTIAGNGGNGIEVLGGDAAQALGSADVGTSDLPSPNFLGGIKFGKIFGNSIGAVKSVTGVAAKVANGRNGIRLSNASNFRIGAGELQAIKNIIAGNSGSGVLIEGAGSRGNVIDNSIIGTDEKGTADLGNGGDGVCILNASENTVGGGDETGASVGNIISGNAGNGVRIEGATATLNRVRGNRIGLMGLPDQVAKLGNQLNGIAIKAGFGNLIGAGQGTNPFKNIIAGNLGAGVLIEGAEARGNVVDNSIIGTDENGAADLGNGGDGVSIVNAPENLVGEGTEASLGNVIAGNAGNGIRIEGTTASGNRIRGTDIGVVRSVGGTPLSKPLANLRGILIKAAANNQIGDPTRALLKNFIAANLGPGVLIEGAEARGNVIDNSIIGTDEEGTAGLGNGGDGVSIVDAPDNVIGVADTSGERIGNVISGNGGNGISIQGAIAIANRVVGNFIGVVRRQVDSLDLSPAGNAAHGILVKDAPGNFIGGGQIGNALKNIIGGNLGAGVLIEGAEARDNVVDNSIIGTDENGAADLGNGGDGVSIVNAPENLFGDGTEASLGNVIAGNAGNGIRIEGTTATGNRIRGTDIGVVRSVGGTPLSKPLPNLRGIFIKAAANHIGDPTRALLKNFIAANLGPGVLIEGAEARGNVIDNSIIGTDGEGTAGLGNGGDGVSIVDAPENVIGVGDVSGERIGNVISGNTGNGVRIEGATASGNRVRGNRVGLWGIADTVSQGLANAGHGVLIKNAFGNFIGEIGALNEPLFAMANKIAGNLGAGVLIEGEASRDNVIDNSIIGTDENGTLGLGNGGDGVSIVNAPENLIGASSGTRVGNVISGNAGNGTRIEGASATHNGIFGNLAGIFRTAEGIVSKRVVNGAHGVLIKDAPGNLIGKIGQSANIIAANLGTGVLIEGVAARGNVVDNSIIGTDDKGTAGLGNGANGVSIVNAPQNVIGVGDATATRIGNVISGNAGDGVRIEGAAADGNSVRANRVGTFKDDADAIWKLANGGSGVSIINAINNMVGQIGSMANQIAGNFGTGVLISGAEASGNVIDNSIIGTDDEGTAGLGNGGDGVFIMNAPGNLIGVGDGIGASVGNIISGNAGNGVRIEGETASDNRVRGNRVGVFGAIGAALRLANGLNGIEIGGASGNSIGGLAGNAVNVIAGNSEAGVKITGFGAFSNFIQNNKIGTDEANSSGVGNDSHGVLITEQARLTTVGGPEAGSGNTIINNGGSGVRVDVTAGNSNLVDPNVIRDNAGLGIDIGPGGDTPNDPGDADEGANRLQNYPEPVSVKIVKNQLVVSYRMTSAPENSDYGTKGIYIEFFKADAAGEGDRFVGSDHYTAAEYNNGTPTVREVNLGDVSAASFGSGDKVTGTATDAGGNSSEFAPGFLVFIDTDGDGLSDDDEINSYGTDPNRADTDGDGQNDGSEVAAGSNPLDVHSLLRVVEVTRPDPSSFTVTWTAKSGKLYRLVRSADPNFTDATVVATDLPGSEPYAIYTDTAVPPESTKMFYRVEVQQ